MILSLQNLWLPCTPMQSNQGLDCQHDASVDSQLSIKERLIHVASIILNRAELAMFFNIFMLRNLQIFLPFIIMSLHYR